ncbi:MAG: class I SAM-dependent methyltransferase [Candidatus Paceibacterota bacterium]
MKSFIELLKKIPIDLGQAQLKHTTKGKQIALNLVPVNKTENTRALDVGCRDGYFTNILKERGYNPTSIDLECIYEGCDKVDVNQPLPYPDNTFEVIWCSEVIEHLENPSFTISEFRRVLTPTGSAILTTPNSYFWIYAILHLLGKRPADVQNSTHTKFFHIRDIYTLKPHHDTVYGFFPYIFKKFRIKNRHLVGFLSPTFIFKIKK